MAEHVCECDEYGVASPTWRHTWPGVSASTCPNVRRICNATLLVRSQLRGRAADQRLAWPTGCCASPACSRKGGHGQSCFKFRPQADTDRSGASALGSHLHHVCQRGIRKHGGEALDHAGCEREQDRQWPVDAAADACAMACLITCGSYKLKGIGWAVGSGFDANVRPAKARVGQGPVISRKVF